MSRNTKIVLGLGLAALMVCCVACAAVALVARSVGSETIAARPDRAARVGHEIADYDVPENYQEIFGSKMFKMKYVVIADPDSNAPIIMLMQFPKDAPMNQEEMQRQMAQFSQQQGLQQNPQYEFVENQTVVIKDQPVTLTVGESRSSQGPTMRQVFGVFPGKEGPAVLMVVGDVESWNQDVLDDFYASIR